MTRSSRVWLTSCAVGLICVLQLLVAGSAVAATSPIVAIAPTSTLTAPSPAGLDNNGVVVGNGTGPSGSVPFTWTASGGYVTLAAGEGTFPGQYLNYVSGVGPSGVILGSASNTYFDGASAITWPAGSGAGATPTFLACYPATQTTSEPCGPNLQSSYASGANASGMVVGTEGKNGVVSSCGNPQFGCPVPTLWPAGGGSPTEVGTATGGGIDVNASGTVLWQGTAGFHLTFGATDTTFTCLGAAARLNASNVVVGTTPGPVISPAYYSSGTCTTLPLLSSTPAAAGGSAEAINDQGVIVGRSGSNATSTAVEWISGQVIDLNSMLPAGSGWVLQNAFAINSSGQILGSGTLNGQATYFLLSGSGRVIGSIVKGKSIGVPYSPTQPVAGATVELVGKTSAGAAFSTSVVTGSDGSYVLLAPAGSYTLTFPAGVCVTGPKTCTRSQAVTVAGSDVTVNGLAVASTLNVKVTLSRESFRLDLNHDGKLETKTVTVTAKIKNTGNATIQSVTPQVPQFSAVGGANTAKIPLKLLKGPSPKDGRDIAPGATIEATYQLEIFGDGKYDIQVLAVGGITGAGRVTGVGTARLTVGSPVLVITSELGRKVDSPDAPKLIRAGTVFTVKMKLENISYAHKIGIYPMTPELEGNAADGHVQTAGLAIQNPSLTAPPEPSEAFILAPRTTREVEIVVRTSATYADFEAPNADPQAVIPQYGTRAVVHIPSPEVADLGKDESVLGDIPARDVSVLGDKQISVGIDDRDFRTPPPESNWAATTAYFALGVLQGAWNLTGGAAVALFRDVPLLLAKGIINVPSALITYANLEAQLWDSIKDNPAQRALYLSGVGHLALLAYKNAPTLAGNTTEFIKKVDKQVLAHFTALANDESSGNYYAAIREETSVFTEAGGNLVLATGLLTRLPAAASALNRIKQASYVRVGEALNAFADGIGAREALTALKEATPGYEFLTTDLKKFYGLNSNQVAYLRGFAERNRLIITLRSRAEESLKWLDAGAVLKPEQIKIKTVSMDDINYLGYRMSDLGRVIVREPPTTTELASFLRDKNIAPDSAEWNAAFKRRLDRSHEWNHAAYDQGYVKYLEDAAHKGEVDLRWNLSANSVDPDVLPNGYTKYGIRLLDEGGGNRVVQFCVEKLPCAANSPGWRSVTGDVDFLSIVNADGSPLSAFQRISVYRQIAKSPVGMLHPAADTWTLIKQGGQQVFDFPVKVNEFVRGGTVAQFAPDGVVRAVTFNKALSSFTNAESYRIFWNGGYQNVKRLLFGVPVS